MGGSDLATMAPSVKCRHLGLHVTVARYVCLVNVFYWRAVSWLAGRPGGSRSFLVVIVLHD